MYKNPVLMRHPHFPLVPVMSRIIFSDWHNGPVFGS